MTGVLYGTVFSWFYRLFGVHTDDELMYWLTFSAIIYTAFVGIASIFIPAPYGKHSSKQTSFTISATAAWIVSVPFLLMFCYCFAFTHNKYAFLLYRYKKFQPSSFPLH